MKHVKFDKNRADFDRYNRFAIDENCFTFFETGEAVFRPHAPDPAQRRLYEAYGVNVFAQHDPNAPTLYTPDGTLVPKAWLGSDLVYMVHDQATDVVVEIKTWQSEQTTPRLHLPMWARNYGCYWPAPGSKPVGAERITLTPPTQYTREEKEYIAGFRGGYDMVVKVEREWQDPYGVIHTMPTVKAMRTAMGQGLAPKEFLRVFSNYVVCTLSEKPTVLLRDEVYVTHLKTTKGGTT